MDVDYIMDILGDFCNKYPEAIDEPYFGAEILEKNEEVKKDALEAFGKILDSLIP